MYSISFSSQHVLVQSLCSKKQNKSISTAWLGSLLHWWLKVAEVIISLHLFQAKQCEHHPAKDHWIIVKETFEQRGEGKWTYGMELWLLAQVKYTEIAASTFTQDCSSLNCLYPNSFTICIPKVIIITLQYFLSPFLPTLTTTHAN